MPSRAEEIEAILHLSECFRAYVAPEDNDGRMYFSRCFVLSAIKNDHFPAAAKEVTESLGQGEIPFKGILTSLFHLSTSTQTNWQNVEPLLDHFYNPRSYDKKQKYWQLPKHVAALPQIYRTLQHEVRHIQARRTYFKELHPKLKATAEFHRAQYKKKNGQFPKSAQKRYERPDKLDSSVVEKEKERCFARIFQRTRELCCFDEETVHFYHAFKLINLFHEKATKDAIWLTTKKKEEKGEDIAHGIRRLTEEYVHPLEEILQYSSTSELITVVLRQKLYSDPTKKVLSDTLATLTRKPYPVDIGKEKRLIPAHIGNCMLGAHMYRLMAARQEAHDDLYVLTKRCQRWMKEIESCE